MKKQVSLFGAIVLGVIAVASILLGEDGSDNGLNSTAGSLASSADATGCAVPRADASRAIDVIEVVDGDTIELD
ncbi:MAG: hypothetical protein ACFB0Z_12770, partial [Candidatus Phaeomarinobacter sp.]